MPQRKVVPPNLKIDNESIEYVNQFNFLGIVIDKHMNWKAHKDMVTKRISKTIGVIHRLKNTIPPYTLLNIYNSLVLSHLNYGLLLWGCKCKNVFVLQKKAIRAVANSKFNCHTSPLFKRFKLLRFPDLCKLQEYKLCHNRQNNKLPEFFNELLPSSLNFIHPYHTRQAGSLRIPQFSHEFARYSIKYRYINTSNN